MSSPPRSQSLPVIVRHNRHHRSRSAGEVAICRGASYVPLQPPPAWQQRTEANLARVLGCLGAPGHVASHRSAALLHGGWTWEREPDVDVITTSSPTARTIALPALEYGGEHTRQRPDRQQGVRRNCLAGRAVYLRRRQRRTQPDEVMTVLGTPTTTPARTIMDCLLDLPGPDAFVTAEGVLVQAVGWDRWQVESSARRQREIIASVGRLLERYPHQRGIRRARAMLPLLDAASESPGESETRYWLLRAGFPRPACQTPVEGHSGMWFPDIVLADTRVAVEFDGAGKYEKDGETLYREKRRQDELTRLGWTVIRVVWSDLRQPQQMIGRVLRAVPPDVAVTLTPRAWMA